MKSITIHKLEKELYKTLVEAAQKEDTSINKIVKRILRQSLGLDPNPRKKIDLIGIAGKWTEQDYKEFEKATEDFDQIEEAEW